MWFLSLLLLLNSAAFADPNQPTSSPATTQPASNAPMKIEVVSLEERRTLVMGGGDTERQSGAQLQIQARLTGGRVGEVVRVGNLILDEAVDDSGKQLVPPDAYPEQARTNTRPVTDPPAERAARGIPIGAAILGPGRGAKKLTKVTGSLVVMYANPKYEDVMIENPLRFRGGLIENPILKEIGMEVRVLPSDEVPGVPDNAKYIALQPLKGEEKLRDLRFFDGWFKRIMSRPRASRTLSGERYMLYQMMGSDLTEDTHLLMEVYRNMETETVKVELTDVELP